MFKITRYRNTFLDFHDKEIYHVNSMDNLCEWLYKNYFTSYSAYYRFFYNPGDEHDINRLLHGNWYLRITDNCDIPIHPYVIQYHYDEWYRRFRNRRYEWRGPDYEFRNGPIPYTGAKRKRRRFKWKSYKGIKQRLSDPYIRPKERVRVMFDPWFEYHSNRPQKSWKKFRKKQWKGS